MLPDQLPRHVAIIMDGNGRWARKRGLPRLVGHERGISAARRAVEIFLDRGVPYLTLFALSTENLGRPKEEVEGLVHLFGSILDTELEFAQEKGIRMLHLGRLEGLPVGLQQKIKLSLKLTENNTNMSLALAFNYGGRSEILEAAKRIVKDNLSPQEITEELFSSYLSTAGLPDPDLAIRTGGEMRISNFLLWQLAYAEFYFTPVLWPDFDEREIDKALLAYSQRQRRFGVLAKDDPLR